jgi:hypothetical protein
MFKISIPMVIFTWSSSFTPVVQAMVGAGGGIREEEDSGEQGTAGRKECQRCKKTETA